VRAKSNYGQKIGFTGRYLDNETGMYYFRARYYSAILGRFIGRDAFVYFDGLSTYNAYFIPQGLDPSGNTPSNLTADPVQQCKINCKPKAYKSLEPSGTPFTEKTKDEIIKKDQIESSTDTQTQSLGGFGIRSKRCRTIKKVIHYDLKEIELTTYQKWVCTCCWYEWYNMHTVVNTETSQEKVTKKQETIPIGDWYYCGTDIDLDIGDIPFPGPSKGK
jgi:RHS repeat-associated protein